MDARNSRDSLLFEAANEAHLLSVEILLDYDDTSPQDTLREVSMRKNNSGNRIDILEKLLVDNSRCSFLNTPREMKECAILL
ncbi:unnamed protein product [Alternaria alternata]